MKQFLYISLGGILGANLRYFGMQIFERITITTNGISVLVINIFGCFLLGFISTFPYEPDHPVKYLWVIGFLGSFTTFSTFIALISVSLGEGKLSSALGFCFVEPILGMIAFWIGVFLGKRFVIKPV